MCAEEAWVWVYASCQCGMGSLTDAYTFLHVKAESSDSRLGTSVFLI